MPRSVTRSSRPTRQAHRVAGSGLTLILAFALAVTGCSSDDKDMADAVGSPPPSPSQQSEAEANAAPGAKSMRLSQGLRKPVTYDDKITVQVTSIRTVRNSKTGPGEMTGRTLTIFTLRFTNGSSRTLDLNQVRVVARYGAKGTQASPTSYANLNDFYGTVAPGKARSASYAFDLPTSGYGKVTLGVKFSETHKVAVFTGAIEA